MRAELEKGRARQFGRVLPTLVAEPGIARLPTRLGIDADRHGGRGHGLKYFSGGDADHREYLRWKSWVQNKMLVMDKLTKETRGSFVYTLLQGRALEVVEHLDPLEYQKAGGDAILFELLDQRWPQKERTDKLGEPVSAVLEGETVRTWCAGQRSPV